MNDLSKLINYKFSTPQLLDLALTHRSYSKDNNERMEFLGDSILNNIISIEIYRRFPKTSEGDLSRLRASLVKGETLAKIAVEYSIGDYIKLGTGELKSGGFRRSSILADALEAIIGAVFLDSDYKVASKFVLSIYSSHLDNCVPSDDLKDPKTRLQEYLQANGQSIPDYDVISITGKSHQQQFAVECFIHDLDKKFAGDGSSRRKAEQQAATTALKYLNR
ncbi:Ribonuclease III [hydrothermal vent metagenome]|uniref:ribonuclease III n=1 Tax=hydrothermal vent metagenome TaxID=652676 RepID=A0A3B0ZPE4_9ZZZZ